MKRMDELKKMNGPKVIKRSGTRWRLNVATHGSEDGDGSPARPFATPQQARDALRARRQTGAELPPGGATVWIHGGEYRLTEPLVFTAADGGTPAAPVVYRAVEGEVVSLSGGARLRGWQPVSDPAVLKRLDPAARGQVWQTDLRAQGIDDFGPMESAERWNWADPGLELFYRDRAMTLARYPNDGFMKIAELHPDVVGKAADLSSTAQPGDAEGARRFAAWREVRGSGVGHFRYAAHEERPRRWAEESAPMLHGWWSVSWADQRLSVARLDPDLREIVLDPGHPHELGYRPGGWFYAYNLLCELDQPGEWYLDRQSGLLYFWPPSGEPDAAQSRPPADGEAVVSVVNRPVSLLGVSHLTLEGLTIELARGHGVTIEDGEHNQILACTIRNVGGDGVRILNGRQHRVAGCDILECSDGGILIRAGERLTLTPGGHEAVNNHIHHIARYNRLYKPGIQLLGVGNRAGNNRIHDLPHVGIGFSGNDHRIENNEIYHVLTEVEDGGAIYTCGAHPEEWTMRGHLIRRNFIHHCSGLHNKGCMGVYLDDMFSSAEITGNIFWEVPQKINPGEWLGMAAVMVGGGRDNRVENNLFIDCARAVHVSACGLQWAAPYVPQLKALIEAIPYREEPWASRYPELLDILDDNPAKPMGNVIARNICWHSPWDDIVEAARPYLCMEDNLIDEDPFLVDEARQDFRLRPDSPAWKLGFQPIPQDMIGLQRDVVRSAIAPREIVDGRLFIEQVPLFLGERLQRPGRIRFVLGNFGDVPMSGRCRPRLSGGRVANDAAFTFALAPHERQTYCFELLPNDRSTPLEFTVCADGQANALATMPIIPEPAATTDWCLRWRVSSAFDGGAALADRCRLPDPAGLTWRDRNFGPYNPRTLAFCDVHEALATDSVADPAVLIASRVYCAEPMQVAALLGYDGPVRLFVDGIPRFHDPNGTNPARPDAACIAVSLEAGEHDLTVMLGGNRGRAYGIILRLQRLDVATEGEVVLPTIHQEKYTCLS
jgi:hypothetical protein